LALVLATSVPELMPSTFVKESTIWESFAHGLSGAFATTGSTTWPNGRTNRTALARHLKLSCVSLAAAGETTARNNPVRSANLPSKELVDIRPPSLPAPRSHLAACKQRGSDTSSPCHLAKFNLK
jgi:hypothetical protein